jgi:hypothetical protein
MFLASESVKKARQLGFEINPKSAQPYHAADFGLRILFVPRDLKLFDTDREAPVARMTWPYDSIANWHDNWKLDYSYASSCTIPRSAALRVGFDRPCLLGLGHHIAHIAQ